MIAFIQKQLQLPEKSVANTVKLLNEDATVPFISRYRKEMTGGLDETEILAIQQLKQTYEDLQKRKESIKKAIAEQEALTPELEKKIDNCADMVSLEDLYLPFKKKRKTRATKAKENGLEPLAKIIMSQQAKDLEHIAEAYLNDAVVDVEAALAGARDIIAEWINENQYIRTRLRKLYSRKAAISTTVVKDKKNEDAAKKYLQYFDWSEPLRPCPSHRLLAILRAEAEGYIRFKVAVEEDDALDIIDDTVIKNDNQDTADQLFDAIKDAYKRLLAPSISNDVLKEAKEQADSTAIQVFANNLRQLLLGAPLGEKRILALDPGFRSGCKLVCLDEKGDLKHNENIYPHPPQNKMTEAMKKVRSLVSAYKIEAIAIGNGTASRETEAFIKRIGFDRDLQVFVVNEAGASVYSASTIARKEFPNYDVTVRGAVSIGRRLADPLAELVKIDPKSIGVGQYQHDVDQGQLKKQLDATVMSCVNTVGVNINTASASLLSYVAGIGPALAENIVKYRSENKGIRSRKELLDVPRLGKKAYEQAAGFIRVRQGENPLDDSAVHPERYKLVAKMAKDVKTPLTSLIGNKEAIQKIDIKKYCTEEVGIPTLEDIVAELEKPGLDPREKAKVFSFDPRLQNISDVKAGMRVPGIVNNITNFGCFVDIGIKESGLVHISKLANTYVSDVNAVVQLHQHVSVKVVEVDLDRKRIQLSMVD
ncbi:MAG: RNA-binding transcriptional accessory protein [Flavobacteriaceae bacterium]|nr:RNA-binding transcriptional accessory protein [Flavobacteriaceae bacterium]